MDYLNDDNFIKFTHKLYPQEEVCLLPNTSFNKLTWNDDLAGINWKFTNCSIIRTSGIDDSGIIDELVKQLSVSQVKFELRKLGYIE